MRVAEDVLIEERRMLENLRFRVQAAAGVIEVNVALVVQSSILAVAKRINRLSGRVFGKGGEKLLVAVDHG